MIDKDLIEASYSKMSDEQLMAVAGADGLQISDEALEILQEEYSKRGLSMSVFDRIIQEKLAKWQIEIMTFSKSRWEGSIWGFAFDQKFNGINNNDLETMLLKKGLTPELCKRVMENLLPLALKNKQNYGNRIIAGGFAFVAGICITLFSLSNAMANGGSYVITGGAILYGAYAFVNGARMQRWYGKIIELLESETASNYQ